MATATLRLCRFAPHYADTVAAWVGDDRELFWVAPGTEPPLTAEKVLAWTRRRGNPCLVCVGDEETPVGYAELNPMRKQRDHLWIGHVVLAPVWRGQGLGVSFVLLLVDHAFDDLGADRVSLVVFPDNRRAIRCYLKAGLTFHEEQQHKFGRPPRSCRMLHLMVAAPGDSAAARPRFAAHGAIPA